MSWQGPAAAGVGGHAGAGAAGDALAGGARAGLGRVTAVARAGGSAARLAAPDDAVAKQLTAAVGRVLPSGVDPVVDSIVCRLPEAWPRFDVGAFRRLARLRAVQADRRAADELIAELGR